MEPEPILLALELIVQHSLQVQMIAPPMMLVPHQILEKQQVVQQHVFGTQAT